jgi:uncharacterized membrane protein YfcA
VTILFFGALVGLALGLTGGGGSVFAVPLLVYALGVAPKDAVVISLAAVATIAAFGALEALRDGLVEWRAGTIYASLGVVGAPVGLAIGQHSSEIFLMIGFALLTLLVAASMWRSAAQRPQEATVIRAGIRAQRGEGGAICRFSPDGRLRITTPCGILLSAAGFGTSMLSGLLGVGGGFLIVPALRLVTRMSMHCAVATSLFVIAAVGLWGVFFEALNGRAPPWQVTGIFVLGGMLGMATGRLGAQWLAGPALERVFAAAMVAVAAFMLVVNVSVI